MTYDHSVKWLLRGVPDIGCRIKIFGSKQTRLKILEYVFERCKIESDAKISEGL